MATHEIAEKDWTTYFQAFTERHRGALVTIEDVDPLAQEEQELEIETKDLPFVSIAYTSNAHGEAKIELVTEGAHDGTPQTHTIATPKEVFHKPGAGVLSSEVNPDEVLEITSSGKPPIHYITFRHPA